MRIIPGDIIDHYKALIKVAHGAKLTKAEQFQIVYAVHTAKFNSKKISNKKDYFDTCNRKRFPEYDRYLQVYDLKVKKRMQYPAIVSTLFPNHSNKEYNSLLKKVKDSYKQAKEMIANGWKHIR